MRSVYPGTPAGGYGFLSCVPVLACILYTIHYNYVNPANPHKIRVCIQFAIYAIEHMYDIFCPLYTKYNLFIYIILLLCQPVCIQSTLVIVYIIRFFNMYIVYSFNAYIFYMFYMFNMFFIYPSFLVCYIGIGGFFMPPPFGGCWLPVVLVV